MVDLSKHTKSGDHRVHDMNHSGAPEKQVNSAVIRKSDGKAMTASGIRK
jgi:hypothetical protein